MSNVSNVELLLNVREQARESSCSHGEQLFFLMSQTQLDFWLDQSLSSIFLQVLKSSVRLG